MSAPGWYPDPSGDPNRIRYWDGSAWSGESHLRRRGSNGWRVGLVALVVVAAVVAAFMLWPGTGTPVEEDTRTARPTGSVWSEVNRSETPTPSPTPPPPTPSDGGQVECPRVDNERITASSSRGEVVGGNLAFPVPEGWRYPYGRTSRVLTDQDTTTKNFPGSTWTSLLVVGVAPHDAGFDDPRTTANQIIDCHITSANFPGLTSSEVEVNEAFTVDGVAGWRVRAHAYTPQAPGGGAVFEVVVLDTGHELGLSAFWGGIVDADPDALAELDATIKELRIDK